MAEEQSANNRPVAAGPGGSGMNRVSRRRRSWFRPEMAGPAAVDGCRAAAADPLHPAASGALVGRGQDTGVRRGAGGAGEADVGQRGGDQHRRERRPGPGSADQSLRRRFGAALTVLRGSVSTVRTWVLLAHFAHTRLS